MAVKAGRKKRKTYNLSVAIGSLRFKNPVILASGTCGFGHELEELIDVNKLGGLITKTVTLFKKEGNRPPRIVETPAGLLNSIGLANGGLKDFMFQKLKHLEKIQTNIIVSIAGDELDEFVKLTESLSEVPCISGIEVNLSCPNIRHKATGLSLLAQDKKAVEKIITKLRKTTKKVLLTKLSPNVTDIKEIAKAAECAGAEALSLVNTYPGMAVDAYTRKPKLGGITGGLSGPCIKPLALKCVWEAYNAVKIPIVGTGGIIEATDVIEFMLCGASAVQIGTANFIDPQAPIKVLAGITQYMRDRHISDIKCLTGALKT